MGERGYPVIGALVRWAGASGRRVAVAQQQKQQLSKAITTIEPTTPTHKPLGEQGGPHLVG